MSSNSTRLRRLLPGDEPSIRRTLKRIIMTTSAVALMIACAAFIASDFFLARRTLARQLTAVAGVVGSQSTAALTFTDTKVAGEILAMLSVEPQVQSACLYSREGRRFAAWVRPGVYSLESPARPGADGPAFTEGRFEVFLPVVQDGERIGTIYLRSDLEDLAGRLWTNLGIVLVVLLASSFAAFLLSTGLEGRITRPILDLALTLREVSNRKDYSIRARGPGEGEFAALVHGFNDMLSQIQSRDAALLQARDDLERRVEERTLELQKKEEQLLQSQKLEAVGHLAGGLAHDFNNLLSVVLGYGDLALSRPSVDPETRGFIEEIQKAGQQAAVLTSQLLAISRQQVLNPVSLHLNVLLEDLRGSLGRLVGERIILDILMGSDLPNVKADPASIQQVVLNLVTHAREAMPGTGRITVETSAELLEEPLTWRNETIPPGSYVQLSVTDTGPGISPEAEVHLFEPFFNGRGRTLDRSTGLGLSTVYGILKQSGGFVAVESREGRGTTFSVYLPVEGDGTFRKFTTTVRLLRTPRAGNMVLLVEDEAMVRRMAGEILRRNGFMVEEAANGREALDLFSEQPDRFDLVVTDVVMPIMGGRELAGNISRLNPATRILFMSGYTGDAELQALSRKHRIPLLSKPFTIAAMTAKVREVLGTPDLVQKAGDSG